MHPTIQQQTSFYNNYWANLKPFAPYKVARIQKILGYLNTIRKHQENLRIVDLGCGDGRCVAIWNEIGKAQGLDLSDQAVASAQERYPFLQFTAGDATKTDYEAGAFNTVISQEVIEHIEDQAQYVNECYRILEDKGFLILTTPNQYYFSHTKRGNYSTQPIEKTLFPSELKKLISAKFDILQMETIQDAKGDFGIYRLLSNSFFVAVLSKLGLDFLRIQFMNRRMLGVHICVLAQKKN